MDDYDCLVTSALKFKGDKKRKKKPRDKETSDRSNTNEEGLQQFDTRADDARLHGGWWPVSDYLQIVNEVSIEFGAGCYARALDNGAIVLGKPHPPGEGPDEEEIFTSVRFGADKFALKSGYGRYVSVTKNKTLTGLSEAIGEPESFIPVFEDNKLALCAFNDCFVSPDLSSGSGCLIARAERVGSDEILNIRVNHDPSKRDRGHE